MNNWTIGNKLITSFLAVAAITLLLGLVGYNGAIKSAAVVTEIGTNRLPSVQSLLVIGKNAERIKTAQRTLMNPDLSIADRQRQSINVASARASYEAAWKIFEALPQSVEEAANWKSFTAAWQDWQNDNNDFFKMNAEFEAFGIPDPKSLESDLFEERGTLWKTLAVLSKEVKDGAVLADDDLTYTLLVDSADDWLAKIPTSNPLIQKQLEEIRPINTALLTGVRKLRSTYARGEKAVAREALEKEVTPMAMKIIVLMRPMRAEAKKVTALRKKMNHQLMTVCYTTQANALALLDKIIDGNVTKASVTTRTSISQAATLKSVNLSGMIVGVAISLGLGLFITRMLVGPIKECVAFIGPLAQGDFSHDVPEMLRKRGDEMGDLSRAFHSLVGNTRKLLREVTSGVQTIAASATELSAVSTQTTHAVKSMSEKTYTVAAAAEEASANTVSVAASMEQTSTNLASVAAATEEMSATVGEIAANSEKARVISGQATAQAKEVSTLMQQLGAAATEIDKVTESITRISAQTNLLALNATIEAASAGDAGRGFAVVANEIKELARQTATATENIKDKIAGVQASTNGAINGIEKISGVINDVGSIIVSIAAAIEEQSSVTKAVAGNIAQASIGVKEANVQIAQTASVSKSIANDLTGVNSAVDEIRQGGENVQASTMDLSKVAEQLKATSDQFKV